jgi:hypothetical protein
MRFEHKTLGHIVTLSDTDLSTIRDMSLEYCFNYGVRQSVQDSYATAKTTAEAQGMAGKRVAKLLEGTMHAQSSAGRFESLCLQIAGERWNGVALPKRKAAIAEAHKAHPDWKADDRKAISAYVAKIRQDKASDIEAEAKRRMESTVAIDLGDLSLTAPVTESAETPAE